MIVEDKVPASRSNRLAACVRAVDGYLADTLDALPRNARRSLIYAAHDALDPDEEERLFAMSEEVESLAPLAGDAFRSAVLARLRAPDQSPPDEPPVEEGGSLTLVDAGKVDDWLRMREIVKRQSEAARSLETALCQRLARAAGTSSNPASFPLSVARMCALFHASMRDLDAGHDARAAIFDAFEATVIAGLDDLVARLLRLLDDDVPAAGAPRDAASPPDAKAAQEPTARDDAAPRPAPRPPRAAADTGPLADPLPGGGDRPARVPAVHPERLLGAIASVERQLHDISTGRGLGALSELQTRLAIALTPPGASLGDREQRAVRAVAGLVHQAFAHPDIDPATQARLWKLAPSLSLLALQDDDQLDLVLQATRHDPVTGLLDRTAFRVRLDAALASAAQGNHRFAVCLIGVDGFDGIGRRLGQQVAGRVLRVLAELMRNSAGASAHLARLRGAEFAALLPARYLDTGWRFANRYLAVVNKAHFALAGDEVSLTVSIGVVESDGSLTTAGQVMRAADAANRSARDDGGGCARVHIPDSFG